MEERRRETGDDGNRNKWRRETEERGSKETGGDGDELHGD
jgi:hypothetical protein